MSEVDEIEYVANPEVNLLEDQWQKLGDGVLPLLIAIGFTQRQIRLCRMFFYCGAHAFSGEVVTEQNLVDILAELDRFAEKDLKAAIEGMQADDEDDDDDDEDEDDEEDEE